MLILPSAKKSQAGKQCSLNLTKSGTPSKLKKKKYTRVKINTIKNVENLNLEILHTRTATFMNNFQI